MNIEDYFIKKEYNGRMTSIHYYTLNKNGNIICVEFVGLSYTKIKHYNNDSILLKNIWDYIIHDYNDCNQKAYITDVKFLFNDSKIIYGNVILIEMDRIPERAKGDVYNELMLLRKLSEQIKLINY